MSLTRRGPTDWYRYFCSSILACSLDGLPKNALTVITYNYDRSFEYFLQTAFAADCNTTASLAAEAVRQIPILHLHGSLGPLHFPDKGGDEPLAFGAELESAMMISLSKNRIRIISDPDVETDPLFQQAHQALREVKQIYFLGFGWAPENLRRLIPHDLPSSGKRIIGTSLGMGKAELERVSAPLAKQHFVIEFRSLDCVNVLKEFCFASL